MKFLPLLFIICITLSCQLTPPVGHTTIVLDLETESLVKELAMFPQDSSFQQWLEAAKKACAFAPKSSLVAQLQQNAPANFPLGIPFSSRTFDLTPFSSSTEIFRIIFHRDTSSKAYLQGVLLVRLYQFGIPEDRVSMELIGDRLTISLQGIYDEARLIHLLTTTGALEFWETLTITEVFPSITLVNDSLQRRENQDTTTISGESETERFRRLNPLFRVLSPPSQEIAKNSPLVGYATIADSTEVNTLLAIGMKEAWLPEDLICKWTKLPLQGMDSVFQLIALKKDRRGGPRLTDAHLLSAYATEDGSGSPSISMEMDRSGSLIWEEITEGNIGKSIAIVLDGEVLTFPTVQGAIREGFSQITGNFKKEEAEDLASILDGQRLPFLVRISAIKTTP